MGLYIKTYKSVDEHNIYWSEQEELSPNRSEQGENGSQQVGAREVVGLRMLPNFCPHMNCTYYHSYSEAKPNIRRSKQLRIPHDKNPKVQMAFSKDETDVPLALMSKFTVLGFPAQPKHANRRILHVILHFCWLSFQ